MARRASGALAAIFALAVVALPVALITTATPADAATAQASEAPATVTITNLSPQWAGPGTAVTVTGIVTNTSGTQKRLIVQLLDSGTPVSSVTEMQQSAAGLYSLAYLPLPAATWDSALLSPGASAKWSIQLTTGAMTSFGVYPVAAQVEDSLGQPLNWTESFLPYVPTRSGPYGSTVPAAAKVAWAWPLIDQPLLDGPWQNACTGTQAATLAQSLGSDGRLGQLLDAATAPAGGAVTSAVQSQKVTSDPGHATKSQTAHGEQPQSLASTDALTWAIDPALVANVSSLAQCGASEPQWSRTAAAWLAKLKVVAAGQPAFLTAYGDPDLGALIGAGQATATDVQRSFSYGRSEANQALDVNLSPAPAGATPTGQAQASGLAWLADSQVSYATLEALAAQPNDVSTVLVSSSAFPGEPTSVLRTAAGNGSYLNVLLASDSLTSVLGAATNAPGSRFAAEQEFLAETALMAQQNPSVPIIVAPPQRWQPPTGMTADLLGATSTAPWLSPASLASLTGAKTIPTVQSSSSVSGSDLSQAELDSLNNLDRQVTQLQTLRAEPDPGLYLAVSTVESSAYEGRFGPAALGMVATLSGYVEQQLQGVRVVAANRITLGGLRGSVPVSVDNTLWYPVKVALQLKYDTTGGTKVAAAAAVLTVPARTAGTVKLRISASQTGSTTISMTLADRAGQVLSAQPVRMTVQTTQVGQLGIIIFAAALGVFLLAAGVRAIRRGGPRPALGTSDSRGPSEDDQSGHSTEQAAPDTVVPDDSELGTAPTPRPR